MFNSKERSAAHEAVANSTTIVGAGTTITGDIESNGDIRIDGTLAGNVFSKSKVIIGAEGNIQGNVNGQQSDILGTVTGRVKVADLLQLRGKAVIKGDIYAGKLQIEPTVIFNGQCHMGANVVELNLEVVASIANQ